MGEENTASEVTPKSRNGWAQPCHATQPPARVAQVDTSPTGLTRKQSRYCQDLPRGQSHRCLSPKALLGKKTEGRRRKGVRSLEKQGCPDNVFFGRRGGGRGGGGLDLNLHACTHCAVLEKNFKQLCNPRRHLIFPTGNASFPLKICTN